jgi:plastocyanin
MNLLDSRFLAPGDCFAQRFPVAGALTYRLVLGLPLFPNAEATRANAYPIEVKPAKKGADPVQQNIVVTLSETGLVADPAIVSIHEGDTLLWYTQDNSVSGFAVLGGNASFHFDSASITGDAYYTHVFGVPGEYSWSDANGSALKGDIRVAPLLIRTRADNQRFLDAMKKANVIEVSEKGVRPDKLEIVIGQTVFWRFRKAPGISVTCVNPQPLPPG